MKQGIAKLEHPILQQESSLVKHQVKYFDNREKYKSNIIPTIVKNLDRDDFIPTFNQVQSMIKRLTTPNMNKWNNVKHKVKVIEFNNRKKSNLVQMRVDALNEKLRPKTPRRNRQQSTQQRSPQQLITNTDCHSKPGNRNKAVKVFFK